LSERERALNAEKETSVKYEQLLQEYVSFIHIYHTVCDAVFTVITLKVVEMCFALEMASLLSVTFIPHKHPFICLLFKSAAIFIYWYFGAKLQATNRVPRPVDRGTATRYGG